MPTKGVAHPIDDEDRRRWTERLAELKAKDPDWNRSYIAKELKCRKSTISDIFNGKTRQSPLKPKIDKLLGLEPRKMPTEQIYRQIIEAAMKLDVTRRERLLERALALLDEQGRN